MGGPAWLDGFGSERRPTTRHTRPARPASALPALIKEAMADVITIGQSWLFTERSDDAAKGEAVCRRSLRRHVLDYALCEQAAANSNTMPGSCPGTCWPRGDIAARSARQR